MLNQVSDTHFKIIDRFGSLPTVEISFASHKAFISKFGGQLLAWEYKGVPILFENENGDLTGNKPYRGGAPICFPFFTDGKFIDGNKHSPSHGEARKSNWECAEVLLNSDSPSVEMRFQGNPIDGVPLELSIKYIFQSISLQIECSVINQGLSTTPFQLAIHSYFEGDALSANLTGVGEKYLDSLDNFDEKVEKFSPVAKLDRIYTSPDENITLSMPKYRLSIHNSNFTDSIVWCPGQDHGISDLGAPNFLCVESGVVTNPVQLASHQTWKGTVQYTVEV